MPTTKNRILDGTKIVDVNLKQLDTEILSQVLVIIPCHNEESEIKYAVNKLIAKHPFHFIVIDDNSTDKSLSIIKENKWNYIHNEKNLGLSPSFREGVKYAIKNGYKYVVQYDGDAQHNADDIPTMIGFAQKGYDIIVTSRYYGQHDISKHKILAHKLLKFFIKLRTRETMTDPTCGLRLYNWTAMQEYVNNTKLEVEPSTIAYLIAKKKLKIKEIPTIVFNRASGESVFQNKKHVVKYMFKQLFTVIFIEALSKK